MSREGKGRTQDLGTYDSRTVDHTFHMKRNSEDLSVGGLAGLLGGWGWIYGSSVDRLHDVVGHSVGHCKGSEEPGSSSIGSTWTGSVITTSSSSLGTGSGSGSGSGPGSGLGSGGSETSSSSPSLGSERSGWPSEVVGISVGAGVASSGREITTISTVGTDVGEGVGPSGVGDSVGANVGASRTGSTVSTPSNSVGTNVGDSVTSSGVSTSVGIFSMEGEGVGAGVGPSTLLILSSSSSSLSSSGFVGTSTTSGGIVGSIVGSAVGFAGSSSSSSPVANMR